MRQLAKFLVVLLLGVAIGAWGAPAPRAQGGGKRPAYVVAETHVNDPASFMQYMRQLPATLAPFHARVLVEALPDAREGAPPDGQVLIIAFGSLQDANRWYDSPAFAALAPLRQKAAASRVYIIDGLPQ